MIDKPAVNEADNQNSQTAVDFGEFRDDELHSDKHSRPKGAWFAIFLAMLALFFTAVGIAVGYKHWQRMNDKARINADAIAELSSRLQEMPSSESIDRLNKKVDEKTAQAITNTDEALEKVARMQNQTRQFADTVASQVEQVTFLQGKMQQNAAPATATDWKVAEVEFLLQLANRELHLRGDVDTAITALQEADILLARVGSVNYLPVRQQIARDISTLEATSQPDISGLSQRINALILSLQPLPALEIDPEEGQEVLVAQDGSANVEGNSLWADYKRKAMDTLNEAIVIRRYDQPIQAALDADARLSLFKLLRLRLESLRLLALRGDTVGFQEQLELIRETVSSYYPSTQAGKLLEKLDEFREVNLEFSPPDISGSLKQLESARYSETTATLETEEGGSDE